MGGTFIYQQDTVRANNLLKLAPETGKTEGLNIQRAPITLKSALFHDTTRRQVQTVQAEKPTYSQIRRWEWLREQKMLIDTSRYILPRNDVRLVSSIVVNEPGLSLPSRQIRNVNTDWLTLLLLVILVLFATVRNSYSKYLGHLFQSLVNYSTAFRMFREQNYSVLHGAFRLEIYFYLTISVFLYQVINHFNIGLPFTNFTLFSVCLGAVLVYYQTKKMAYRLLGAIIEGSNETGEYLFNMDNYNRVAALFLFPIISFIAFYPFENRGMPVYFGIFTVAGFYILLLQRGIIILLKKQFFKFYLFLYLCSLEFLPLLLIYKIVVVG